MEIAKLISALEETIALLQTSQSSDWAHISVAEVTQVIESEIAKARELQPIDAKRLEMLFAPTGPIQEISIDNGWGHDFIRISEIVERLLGKR